MPVDTRGLQQEHVGKRLEIKLQHGGFDEVKLLELTVCDEPEPCCGITYRLLSAGHGATQRERGEVYWMGFDDIAGFRVLGD